MNVKGKQMVDATAPLTLKVRRADINGAVARDPEHCVVARAATRTMGDEVLGVKIGACVAYVELSDCIVRYAVSEETKRLVRGYDAAGVYPVGIPARLLVPSRKLGKYAGKPRAKGNADGSRGPSVRNAKTPWLRHVNQP